jgi:hypothetical protein
MKEIRKFQEMISRLVVDAEGDITVFIEDEDLGEIIEGLKRVLDEKQ